MGKIFIFLLIFSAIVVIATGTHSDRENASAASSADDERNEVERGVKRQRENEGSTKVKQLPYRRRYQHPLLHPAGPRIPKLPLSSTAAASSSSTSSQSVSAQPLELHLPTEVTHDWELLQRLISCIYELPTSLFIETENREETLKMRDPFVYRSQVEAQRYYARKLKQGDYSFVHENILSHLPKGSDVDQLSAHLADKGHSINKDFDIRAFRQIPMGHFKHIVLFEDDDGLISDSSFDVRAAIQEILSLSRWLPKEYTDFMGKKLVVHIEKECGNRNMKDNGIILCALGHFFAFAVELERILEEQFLPFQQAVLYDIGKIRSDIPVNRKWNFNTFLAWIKMKVDASWMKDAALTIFAHEPKMRKANQTIRDPTNPSRMMGGNVSKYFEDVCQSYQALAVELLSIQIHLLVTF